MKSLLLLLVLFFLCSETALSQPMLNQIYGEIGGSYGTHGTFKAGVNCVFNKKRIITICYLNSWRKAANTPQDYSARGLIVKDVPRENLHVYGIMSGQSLNSNTRLRFTIKGGISLVNVNSPVSFQPSKTNGWPISYTRFNYTWTVKRDFVPGLLFNPTMEVLFGKWFGLSIGLYINANWMNPVCGLECNLLFGKTK